jgi:hypothetical protein
VQQARKDKNGRREKSSAQSEIEQMKESKEEKSQKRKRSCIARDTECMADEIR